jgi:hypothetical protein
MQRSGVLLLALCALGVAGCSDDATAPTNLPMVFTAQLSPANEVPAIGNAENTGRGAVQITFTVTRDAANAITAGTVSFHFQLNGFPGTTSIVGAHIHPGVAGVNGGVVVNSGITAGTAVTGADGVLTFTSASVTVAPATIQAIIDNPAGYYFNVHSPLNPAGVARGQLSRTL